MIQSQSIETPYKRGEMLSNMILYEEKNFQSAIYIAGLKNLNIK